MKKIVFLMGGMGRGGAERVVSILSKHYCDMGHSVDICMLLNNENDGYIIDNRVNIIDMSHSNISNTVIKWIRRLKAVRKYIQQCQPNIIIPFLAKTNVILILSLIGINKKVYRIIASERIDPYNVKYPWILRRIVNYSYGKADLVVFQTKRAQSYYSSKIQKKSVIIGNPININIKKSDKPEKVIVNAGRLEEQKNQKLLIDAFAEVSFKYPQYTLKIFGDGSLRADLQQLIRQHGMQERIVLMGSKKDYLEQLSKAEIFVLSSNYEGLSNALLEAMALGIPCISTNCAGSDEVIKNEVNGILVPKGNQELLARALEKLISNKKLRKKLSEEGQKVNEYFGINNIINKWDSVLVQQYKD